MANTTWSTTDKTASITLSGGNLVATATAGNQGIRSADKQITGKFYFELAFTLETGQANVGVASAGAALNNGNALATCALYANNGLVFLNNVSTGVNLGTRANGDIIGVAVDITNQLIWFRVAPSGNWNNNAAYAPGGSGGISLASIFGAGIPLYAYTYFVSNAEVRTANFGDTAFSGTVPSGFTSGFTAGASPPTNALATQAALEHWLTVNAPAQITQTALEHWMTVTGTGLQAAVTQVALEHWMTVASVSSTPAQARAMVMA